MRYREGPMIAALTNPDRFMAFSRWAAPVLGAVAAVLGAVGLWLAFSAPPERLQSYAVHIMFIHVPAAWMSVFVYVCLGVASFISFVFRQPLADAAARTAAPLGAALTFLALVTGSLWGRTTWNTWWFWDARLTSVLVLFLFYLSYLALRAAIDDEARAGRAAAILAMVGLINLPIVHFSVEKWFQDAVDRWSRHGLVVNTLHQPSSVLHGGGPTMSPVYLTPLLIMGLCYLAAFGALWLTAIRAEVWRRRANVLALRAAR
jgi:heme exporter protein C